MKIITRQSRANGVAKEFMETYGGRLGGISWKGDGETHGQILEKLQALGDEPNPDVVDGIIGNPSWTGIPVCDECSKKQTPPFIIEVGEEYDYESRTARLCGNCIKLIAECADNLDAIRAEAETA